MRWNLFILYYLYESSLTLKANIFNIRTNQHTYRAVISLTPNSNTHLLSPEIVCGMKKMLGKRFKVFATHFLHAVLGLLVRIPCEPLSVSSLLPITLFLSLFQSLSAGLFLRRLANPGQ